VVVVPVLAIKCLGVGTVGMQINPDPTVEGPIGHEHSHLKLLGETTGLGAEGYMQAVKENCLAKHMKGACEAYSESMKTYFDRHKEVSGSDGRLQQLYE
jgi:hypothetical protein